LKEVDAVRLLFFKEAFTWPRAKGHDVHGYYMMKALGELGHEVSLATLAPPPSESVQGLQLRLTRVLRGAENKKGNAPLVLTRLQERFRSYWGIETASIQALGQAAHDCEAEAVVAVGLSVLPYLAGVQGAKRVWYAADEWAWHHFSQVRLFSPSTWADVRAGLVKGLYERTYASLLDRVWVVTEADRRSMRWVAGTNRIDVVPNGVDGEQYRPQGQPQIERSCVFWGRLDFGPNIQAIEWFCKNVWPAVRFLSPTAQFTIYGFNPTPQVLAFANRDGVKVVADLPDLRSEVDRHQVVVLPFVSGGGIKNKLLEAAGLGKAIVCSPQACGGLRVPESPPFQKASSAKEWVAAIRALWVDSERRLKLGTAARKWVLEHHTWQAAARDAVAGLGKPTG
jgi:glycosyltransferase involved in cell wall biosynthesis